MLGKFANKMRHDLESCLPYRNGFLEIELKKYGKADIKVFWSCLIFAFLKNFLPNVLSMDFCRKYFLRITHPSLLQTSVF